MDPPAAMGARAGELFSCLRGLLIFLDLCHPAASATPYRLGKLSYGHHAPPFFNAHYDICDENRFSSKSKASACELGPVGRNCIGESTRETSFLIRVSNHRNV